MRFTICDLRFTTALVCAWLAAGIGAQAQETDTPAQPIDLPTTLKLAGAQNLDALIARAQAAEARAQHEQARAQFFPWITPSVGYRRHEGNIQDVVGNIIETDKQSYTAGGTVTAQLDLGDAIYQSLAKKQLARAADEAADARRQESIFNAAAEYFELSRTTASVAAAAEAVRIAEDYSGQVERAVAAGIAFKGDVFRAQVQVEKNRMLQRQLREQQQVSSARLAQLLRLPPAIELTPQALELSPALLVHTNAALDALMARALASRPELRQSKHLTASARMAHKGTTVGPLIPTLNAQASFGGLGGGVNHDTSSFDRAEDYFVGLSWRIGPGGLFDADRTRAATARMQMAELQGERTRQDIERQVIEAHARVHSLADQLGMAQRALTAAEQLLKLSRERKAFGAAAVLETIQAEQELTRARLDYFTTLAAHNRAQFSLWRAVGEPSGTK